MKLSPALQEAICLINAECSYNEATDRVQRGLTSQRAYDWYVLLWKWSTHRSLYEQGYYYKKRGSAAYWRRINRCRAFISANSSIQLPPI